MAPAQGRDSANLLPIIAALCSFSLLGSSLAAQYTVGDTSGWVLGLVDYSTWAAKYSFKTGDTLLFTYQAEQHSVYQVSQADYQTCNIAKPIKMYSDGSTVITLSDATSYYFVCGVPGHCSGGMKVAVTVLASAAAPSTAPTPSSKATPPPTPVSSPPPPKSSPAPAPVSSPPPKSSPAPAPKVSSPVPSPVSSPPSPTPTPTPSSAASPTPTPSSASTPTPSTAPSPASPTTTPPSSFSPSGSPPAPNSARSLTLEGVSALTCAAILGAVALLL